MSTQTPPRLTTIGLHRNKIGWVVVELTTEGDQVIERKETPPEIRRIALELVRKKFFALITRAQQ